MQQSEREKTGGCYPAQFEQRSGLYAVVAVMVPAIPALVHPRGVTLKMVVRD